MVDSKKNYKFDLGVKGLMCFLFGYSILFPGGGADIYDSPYSRTGNIIFNLAKKANDAGDVFPLWGTCLGFQFLSVQGAGGRKITSDVDGEDFSVPLNLSEGENLNNILLLLSLLLLLLLLLLQEIQVVFSVLDLESFPLLYF